MKIKVLGTGCPGCKALHYTVKRVVNKLAVEATIEKVEDYQKILEYGVMSTPALVINEKVVASGKLSEKKVKSLVQNAL